MTFRGLFLACLGIGFTAQASPQTDPGLLGEKPPPEESRELTWSEQDGLINKPRIAEETYGRLQSLREAGNPHIRRGLLLSKIQEDPERSRVDPQRLREDALRRFERREADPNRIPETEEDTSELVEAPPSPPKAAPEVRPFELVLAGLGIVAIATGLFLFIFWK